MGDGGMPRAGRGALPSQLGRFFGRDRETEELVELLDRERLVTLVGAPGGGKTRLAIQVATERQPVFPGGVRFVELTAVPDAESVPRAVAVTFDVAESTDRPQVEALADELRISPPVLLVLDNCEHVLDTAAPLARRLVEACPGVTVLATSRSALGVDGEVVWPVPPLDAVAATRLFMDRALALSASAAFEPGDEALVEAICRGLDCLPLAVELTAAWSRALSPSQILERLAQSLPDSGRPSRGRDVRHVTMGDAIGWSYRRLPPDTQALFRHLSVFVGGFDLDAAVAVVGSDDEAAVLSSLRMLLDDSLVLSERVDGGPMRYRMLEPVRQHASGLLAADGEEDVARRRHADYFLALAGGYDPWGSRGGASTVPLARLQQDDGNLHSAFGWAYRQPGDLRLQFADAMTFYWAFGGRVAHGVYWLGAVLAAESTKSADPRLVAIVHVMAGLLGWRQGNYDDADRWLRDGLERADALGDDLVRAQALSNLGTVDYSAGRLDDAVEHSRAAMAIYEAFGDEVGATRSLMGIGWAHHGTGDSVAGDATFQQILDANRQIGNPTFDAFGHIGLAYGAMLRRDAATQREHMTATLAAMEAGGVVERTDWLWLSITLAGLERRSRTSYRLLGGVETVGRLRGGSRMPQALGISQELFDAIFLPVRRDVSPEERDVLTEEGRHLTWEELAVEALAEPTARTSPLTDREEQIAELVAAGLSNADIARKFGISRRTVESHLDHIKQKLGLSSRNEVIAWAYGGLHQPKY